MVWTKEQAEEALSLDAEAAMKAVMRMTPGIADDTLKLAAITDFVFNLGPGRLQASTLRRRINAGQYEQVPDELRKWVWGGGKKLPGLIMRREDEVRLWQTTPVEA
jgi:lysozyme